MELEKFIRISLHSRSLHNDAQVIYNNPHLFSTLQRAWAVWMLCHQSFSSKMDDSWGYDKKLPNTTAGIFNKRESFTEEYSIRLQNVQIEHTDSLRIINSRDYEEAFHYCDPPYYNSDCGHYDGYSKDDYVSLLRCLSQVKGKFLLSSYPSEELDHFSKDHGWHTLMVEQNIQVATISGKKKKKIEILTANYLMQNQIQYEQLQY